LTQTIIPSKHTSSDQNSVDGSHFQLVFAALLQTAEEEINDTHSNISVANLQNTKNEVQAEWIRLLNASLPDGSPKLSLEAIVDTNIHYSNELYWIAHHYASNLFTKKLSYWNNFANLLINKIKNVVTTLQPLPRIYQKLPNLLLPMTIVPVEIERKGYRMVKVKWAADKAMKHIGFEHRDVYLQNTVQFIATIVREIPHIFNRQSIIYTQEVFYEPDTFFEWTIAWQEDLTKHRYAGLAIGIGLSFLLSVGLFFDTTARFIQWIIVAPLLLGILWYMVLKIGEYAGDQEHALQRIVRSTNDQVETLRNLHQIDRELNLALSLDRVLTFWLDWAMRLTYANSGHIVFVDGNKGSMRLVKNYGYAKDEVAAFTKGKSLISVDVGISGRSARTGNSFYVPDVSKDTDYVVLSEQVRSQLTIPVKHGQDIIAVFSLEKHDYDSFSTIERARVARLCERATIALVNARLLQETQQEREKLSTVLTTTEDSVIVTDPDANIILVNRAAVRIFGLDPQADFTDQPFKTVFADSPLLELFNQGRKTNGFTNREFKYNETTFQINMAPVQHVGYSMILHDITLFKELDNLKNDLVATVSHDLKNPLGAINGYLELIAMLENLSDRGNGYLHQAKRVINNMSELIEDLLSVSRLESGQIALDLQPTEVETNLKKAIENHRLQIDEKHTKISINIEDNLPYIYADSWRLGQILNNLIGNAIKYSPPDSQITLSAQKQDDNYITICVKDTGIGIPADAIHKLFEKFSRVRDEQAEGIEGTGLGLYIVKKLVEVHGGQIWVESVHGEGSSFIFTMPIATLELETANTNADEDETL
jgi:PAS domain S-box-containing protein